jgi:uncharacterized protein DUF4231
MKTKYERLLAEVQKESARFDKESTKHKKLYRWLRILALSLTAVATILGSATLVAPAADKAIGFAIVIVTAVAGVIGSIEGLRKPSELWMIERNIFHTLNDLRREIEYFGAEGVNDERLDRYFTRLQDILYSSSQKWSRNIKEQEQLPPQWENQSRTPTAPTGLTG